MNARFSSYATGAALGTGTTLGFTDHPILAALFGVAGMAIFWKTRNKDD